MSEELRRRASISLAPVDSGSGAGVVRTCEREGASRRTATVRTIRSVLASVLLLLLSASAWGWGNEGHQTVGAMADSLLAGTRAEQQVHSLLLSGESLAKVSIWMDCAKGYCGQLTPEMEALVAANPRHHNYHFTDLPFEADRYVVGAVGTEPDDIVQMLGQAIAMLKGQADAGSNPHNLSARQALLLIVHLVGDLHQPLHVGTPT